MSNQSTENRKTYRLTKPKKHHFFGFHDLLISNKKGDKVLSLQVDDIDHPPRIGQKANIGFIDDDSNEFHYIASTTAWNFPQGARLSGLATLIKLFLMIKLVKIGVQDYLMPIVSLRLIISHILSMSWMQIQ